MEEYEPYLKLWAAVIELAVSDVLSIKPGKVEPDQQRSAEWIASMSNAPLSFHWACDMLNVSPVAVREMLDGAKP